MKLSILIATVIDRRQLFIPLMEEFQRQTTGLPVEIVYSEDNKEMSVGKKRQLLLESASGDYIVYFDSDDVPRPYYVSEILKAIDNGPDCVGFRIQMTTNGIKPQICEHSLKHPKWIDFYNKDGITFARNVTHFNPVKRNLALKVGFEDKRYGEDRIYSDKVTLLCKEEIFIDKIMFDYRFSTKQPHNEKYGIK